MGRRLPAAQTHFAAQNHFDNVPVKPQRVYEEMNKALVAMFAMSPPLVCRKLPLRKAACL